ALLSCWDGLWSKTGRRDLLLLLCRLLPRLIYCCTSTAVVDKNYIVVIWRCRSLAGAVWCWQPKGGTKDLGAQKAQNHPRFSDRYGSTADGRFLCCEGPTRARPTRYLGNNPIELSSDGVLGGLQHPR
ncbi:unnamed protein product, partial [Ectocarpus sp. 8 AP-2014]